MFYNNYYFILTTFDMLIVKAYINLFFSQTAKLTFFLPESFLAVIVRQSAAMIHPQQ